MDTQTKQELIKEINTLRKQNKNSWYYFRATFNGKKVIIKGYNTWIQIFKFGNLYYDFPMDISVNEYNKLLNECFS